MLQFLVCSDLHTYADSIRLAIRKLDRVDAILIAGDLETERERLLEYAEGLPLYAVCGNNDYYLNTEYPEELLIDIAESPVEHPGGLSSNYPAIATVRELSYKDVPEKYTSLPSVLHQFAPASVLERLGRDLRPPHISHRILMTHGNVYKVPETGKLSRRAALWNADLVIFGHTHEFTDLEQKSKNIRFLNPGCLLGDPESSIRRFAGYEICSFAVLCIGFGGEIRFRQLRL